MIQSIRVSSSISKMHIYVFPTLSILLNFTFFRVKSWDIDIAIFIASLRCKKKVAWASSYTLLSLLELFQRYYIICCSHWFDLRCSCRFTSISLFNELVIIIGIGLETTLSPFSNSNCTRVLRRSSPTLDVWLLLLVLCAIITK